jgi:hypothetical protein
VTTTKPPTPIRTTTDDPSNTFRVAFDPMHPDNQPSPTLEEMDEQERARIIGTPPEATEHQPPKVIVPSVVVTVGASQNRGAALIASGSAMLTVALVYQAHEGFHMLMVLLSLVGILALVCGLPSMNDDDTSVGTRP